MKLLVLSDIHANIWALQTIIEQEKKYDILCFAGDATDYGTEPTRVIDYLKKLPDVVMVQGNHDRYVIAACREESFKTVADKQYKWVHYNAEKMKPEYVDFLEGLPLHQYFYADGWAYLMQHQFVMEKYDIVESRGQFEAFWREHTPKEYWDAPKRRMIFGHSHRQCIHVLGENMEWINPGSISYRRDDDSDKTAHYMVIEDGAVSMKQIPYDRNELYQEACRQLKKGRMMDTEIQNFFFFFGNAVTSRDPLPEIKTEF